MLILTATIFAVVVVMSQMAIVPELLGLEFKFLSCPIPPPIAVLLPELDKMDSCLPRIVKADVWVK